MKKLNPNHFKRAVSPLKTAKFWAIVLVPVIVILAIALPIILTWGSNTQYNMYLYVNETDSYTFRGNPDWKNRTEITAANIGATHKGKPVTTIGYNAFRDFKRVTKIELPGTIINIEDGAFQGCTALTEINLPDTITTIQQSAFRDCTSLKEIIWPPNLTYISAYMFANCTGLETIYLTSASMVQCSPTSFENIRETIQRIWISENNLFQHYWTFEHWTWANGSNRDLFLVGSP